MGRGEGEWVNGVSLLLSRCFTVASAGTGNEGPVQRRSSPTSMPKSDGRLVCAGQREMRTRACGPFRPSCAPSLRQMGACMVERRCGPVGLRTRGPTVRSPAQALRW